MRRALALAGRAAQEGEIPVGAMVLRGDRVLGSGWNRSETMCDPTAHAEINALRRAAAVAGNWRLTGTVVVTTLEPCPMCRAAIEEARVAEVWWGAPRTGRDLPRMESSSFLAVFGGIEEAASRALLVNYFENKRSENKRRGARAVEWAGFENQ